MAVAWLAHDPVEVFSLKSVILMAHGCSVMLPVFSELEMPVADSRVFPDCFLG